jgi:hypothetical protein
MSRIPKTEKICNTSGVHKGGQARISCPPQISTGLDKLEVSLWLSSESREIFSKLSQKKKDCQDLDLSMLPVNFGDKNLFNWNLSRTGTKQYSFVLKTGDITLQLSTREHDSNFPNCRIEIGSVSCQEHSIRIYDRLLQWLQLYGLKREKELVSRVDLATDYLGLNIENIGLMNRRKWICRARKFDIFFEGLKLNGIMLGRGGIILRIYNKKQELTANKTKKEFFINQWKCDEETEVTRFEFQFRREVLKEMKIPVNTVAELEKNADSLWQYATTNWARLSSRSIDQENNHQDRAEISEIWTKIQGAFFIFPQLANIREKKTLTKNLIALREQARGCLLNLAAAVGHDQEDYFGIIATLRDAVAEDIAHFMTERYVDFCRLYQIRRNQIYVGF